MLADGGWLVTPERRLVLVGAGHAHLHLLRHPERLVRAGYRTTLVAPRHFHYSGVAVAVTTGALPPETGRIDIAGLVRGHLDHRPTTATAVDVADRVVRLADGGRLTWDLLSLDIGSTTRVPSTAPAPTVLDGSQGVLALKPLEDLHRLRQLLDEGRGRPPRITVLGAGSSGVELAAQLALHPDVAGVWLIERGERIGGDLSCRARTRLTHLLERRGVRIEVGAEVSAIEPDHVLLGDGRRIAHDLALLAAGLSPAPLAASPPLGGPDGIPVRATLQHRDHDDVYAAGDCSHFLPAPLPRIGVHGVRQGSLLLASLEARTTGGDLPTYTPPRRSLSILDLGGGTALASRGRWWWMGPEALRLKRRIDRRWLTRHQSGPDGGPQSPPAR